MKFMKKNSGRRWALGLLGSALTFSALAHAGLTFAGEAQAGFQAIGPGGLKISGSTDELMASEDAGVITVKVEVKKLKTGIDMRDGHMKKAIKAAQHPTATLQVKRADLKFPADNATAKDKATGTFTFAGVSKPMTFGYEAKRTGSDYHVQALSTFDYTDHGIEEQCYLGVCVDKQVKIKAKFKMREK